MSKNTKYQKKKICFLLCFLWRSLVLVCPFVLSYVNLFVAAFLLQFPFVVTFCSWPCFRVPFAVSLRCLCSFLLFMAVLVYAGVPFVSSFCSWLCWRRFFAVAVCLVFPFCFFCSLLSFVLSLSLCSRALATVDMALVVALFRAFSFPLFVCTCNCGYFTIYSESSLSVCGSDACCYLQTVLGGCHRFSSLDI